MFPNFEEIKKASLVGQEKLRNEIIKGIQEENSKKKWYQSKIPILKRKLESNLVAYPSGFFDGAIWISEKFKNGEI